MVCFDPHKLQWFGTVRDCNVLVLPVLGRSLSSVLQACGDRFSLPTVLMLADQLVKEENSQELPHAYVCRT